MMKFPWGYKFYAAQVNFFVVVAKEFLLINFNIFSFSNHKEGFLLLFKLNSSSFDANILSKSFDTKKSF